MRFSSKLRSFVFKILVHFLNLGKLFDSDLIFEEQTKLFVVKISLFKIPLIFRSLSHFLKTGDFSSIRRLCEDRGKNFLKDFGTHLLDHQLFAWALNFLGRTLFHFRELFYFSRLINN